MRLQYIRPVQIQIWSLPLCEIIIFTINNGRLVFIFDDIVLVHLVMLTGLGLERYDVRH